MTLPQIKIMAKHQIYFQLTACSLFRQLQPHLILRVLHRILIFYHTIIPCQSISPTWFGHLPPPLNKNHSWVNTEAFSWILIRSCASTQLIASMHEMHNSITQLIIGSYLVCSQNLSFNLKPPYLAKLMGVQQYRTTDNLCQVQNSLCMYLYV